VNCRQGVLAAARNDFRTPTASEVQFWVSVADSKGDSKEQALQMTVASAPAANPPASNRRHRVRRRRILRRRARETRSRRCSTAGVGQFGQDRQTLWTARHHRAMEFRSGWRRGLVASMSGDAAEFNVGGWTPYSDALWNNHLIGPGSSQGCRTGTRRRYLRCTILLTTFIFTGQSGAGAGVGVRY